MHQLIFIYRELWNSCVKAMIVTNPDKTTRVVSDMVDFSDFSWSFLLAGVVLSVCSFLEVWVVKSNQKCKDSPVMKISYFAGIELGLSVFSFVMSLIMYYYQYRSAGNSVFADSFNFNRSFIIAGSTGVIAMIYSIRWIKTQRNLKNNQTIEQTK